MSGYEFTQDWFEKFAKPNWDQLIPQITPQKILEIGSFEGASACYLIQSNAWADPLKLFCADTWEGGIEHERQQLDLTQLEKRFDSNLKVAIESSERTVHLNKLKGRSENTLCNLIREGHRGTFDLIYVDGSHQAPDALTDAVLGFQLCKTGGLIIFDDYLWTEKTTYGADPIRSPKLAIDSFTNIFCRQINIYRAPLYQLYLLKTGSTHNQHLK